MSRVGVVFGGRSVEHEVSVASARTVVRGLRDSGHEVLPLGVGPDGGWVTPSVSESALRGEIDQLPPGGRPVHKTLGGMLERDLDALFPIIHGTWGEDGTLQGLCEMLDLPYVGAGVATSAVCMDKALCKIVLNAHGVPTVEGEVVTPADLDDEAALLERLEPLGATVFVKPVVGGSSVGVERVADTAALPDALRRNFRFDDRLLVERAVVGREIEVAVIGDAGALEASVPGEIVPGVEFYDYADKYVTDAATLLAPAELDAALAARIRETAVRAFAAVGGWGMARVDFLVEEGVEPFVNEINTLPGFTEISMYPRLWGISGLPLPALVNRLVEIALARHAARRRLDEGIKDWIAELAERQPGQG